MIFGLYSVQDVMIDFGAPNLCSNDELAKRGYHNILKNHTNPEDLRLFKIGTFDTSTGTVIGITPELIEGGGNKDGEL